MAGYLHADVLDNGLAFLKANADRVYICSAQPATYTEATSTYALGVKDFGAGGVFPGAITTDGVGRIVTAAAITNAIVPTSGDATYWAVVDSVSSTLLASYFLSAPHSVVVAEKFSLDAFDVSLPYPTS